jgi:hypothetical protein
MSNQKNQKRLKPGFYQGSDGSPLKGDPFDSTQPAAPKVWALCDDSPFAAEQFIFSQIGKRRSRRVIIPLRGIMTGFV